MTSLSTYLRALVEPLDLVVDWDITTTREDLTDEEAENRANWKHVVALSTYHEPAAGCIGRVMTPYFDSEEELAEYVGQVIRREIPDGDLADYLKEVVE